MLINVTVQYVAAILSGEVTKLENYEIDALVDFMDEVGHCKMVIVKGSKAVKRCYVSGAKAKTVSLNIISK